MLLSSQSGPATLAAIAPAAPRKAPIAIVGSAFRLLLEGGFIRWSSQFRPTFKFSILFNFFGFCMERLGFLYLRLAFNFYLRFGSFLTFVSAANTLFQVGVPNGFAYFCTVGGQRLLFHFIEISIIIYKELAKFVLFFVDLFLFNQTL